jgi:hypothetical protein
MGMHHASRKWAHVVHPFWRLMGPQVYIFGSNSFFLENFHDIFPQIYFHSYLHEKTKMSFLLKTTSFSVVFIQELVQFRTKHQASYTKVNTFEMHRRTSRLSSRRRRPFRSRARTLSSSISPSGKAWRCNCGSRPSSAEVP